MRSRWPWYVRLPVLLIVFTLTLAAVVAALEVT